MLLRDFEQRDELGGGDELHLLPSRHRANPIEIDACVFPVPGTADQAAVETLFDPFAAGQFEDLRFGTFGVAVKSNVSKSLIAGKPAARIRAATALADGTPPPVR